MSEHDALLRERAALILLRRTRGSDGRRAGMRTPLAEETESPAFRYGEGAAAMGAWR